LSVDEQATIHHYTGSSNTMMSEMVITNFFYCENIPDAAVESPYYSPYFSSVPELSTKNIEF
jgi:hypothetical protein